MKFAVILYLRMTRPYFVISGTKKIVKKDWLFSYILNHVCVLCHKKIWPLFRCKKMITRWKENELDENEENERRLTDSRELNKKKWVKINFD